MSLDLSKEQPLRGQVVDWLMRLQEQPDDLRLRAEFDAWLAESDRHRTAYGEMAPLWQQAERVGALRADRWQDSRAQPRAAPVGRTKRRLAAAVGLALAASLAFFVLPTARLWLAADHHSGVAELREVLLEDGSRAILNAQTAIAVDYSQGMRSVTLLSGQAFFEVTPAPERPFVVKTELVTVRVTGTAFDVAMSGNDVTVAVRSGSVKVTETARGVVADLGGGQQVRVSRSGVPTRSAVSSDDVGVWRDRRLVVYDRTIREVAREIAAHTNAAIIFSDSDIADQRVTATIDLRHPREALRAIIDLKYGKVVEFSPFVIVISSR